ncbi:hypothetical protein DYU11_07225 [Fibrisoma montanum]|uniref:Uncharacterized protein n=1 Tax=Fibrisoma montanum TaxID=2305895 RepID=A0A418MEG3_9BACT|nr:hypothetical protein [Fibrisoma montanum]RIV25103.1 hypothetical protein DYU11_07225 [Fibrisoma montanum]
MDKQANRILSAPACYFCAHMRAGKAGVYCSAYPDGIPARIRTRGFVHDQVEPDQVGTDVFEPMKEEVEV